MLHWLLIMATTIVSNLVVASTATGRGNQGHLVYAANQQRWWCFVIKTLTATTVAAYVSSSNDLTTATWSEGTGSPSPAFPSSHALVSGDAFHMGCVSITNGSTDAAHISVSHNDSSTGLTEHIRCTFTGTATVSWDAAWVETSSAGTQNVTGIALGVSTTSKFVHEARINNGSNMSARLSTNADSGATWTSGFGAYAQGDTGANSLRSYALAQLASDAMLCVYDNGGAADPNATALRDLKYTSGTTWPTTGSGATGNGTTTQDKNDWCLCAVDTTHVYAFRRSGTNTFDWRVYNGSTWATPANGVPNQNHLAASGMFAATDGASLWLFVLDSASNQPVQYVKASSANGATPTWGSWTQLEAAGSTARNAISGNPTVSNQQIGVIYTAVNGSNFDIVLSALNLAPAGAYLPYDIPHSPQHQTIMAM